MGEIFVRPIPLVPMPCTGERLTSELTGQTEIEHLHRYFIARHFCRDKDVLDVAAGEGYGSALLAQTAASVIGVDISAEAVAHASASYRAPRLRFLQGDAQALPLPDDCVDVVVSFETIEHFVGHVRFMTEIRRVLRQDGLLVISTPDRDNYSPAGSPANPYHTAELSREEFGTLLSKHFRHQVMLLQRPIVGSLLVAASKSGVANTMYFEKRGPGHFEGGSGLARAQYAVAIASNVSTPDVLDSFYIETSLLGARDQRAVAELEALRAERDALRAERDALLHANEKTEGAVETICRQLARERESSAQHRKERDEAIEAMRQELTRERESSAKHRKERDEAIEAMRQELTRERESSAQHRKERDEAIEAMRQQIEALLASNSWRVTAPLRAVSVRLWRRQP